MPNHKGKLPPSKLSLSPGGKEIMRFVGIRAETANAQQRSVQVVVATENPVERYDKNRNTVVREVLLMDGLRMKGGRTQLPIVDSHDRSTTRNVYGSVRNLRIERDELVGDASFASDAESQIAYQKLLDGHLSDFSITASANEVGFVDRGSKYISRNGAEIDGPADIVTSWTPTDASLCAAGADERSTVRRSYTDLPKPEELKRMSPELMKMLVAKGMPSDLSTPDEMLLWMCGQMSSGAPAPETETSAEPPAEEMLNAEPPKPIETPKPEGAETMAIDAKKLEEETTKAVEKAMKDESIRRKEINALCSVHKIERTVENEYIDSGATLDVVRTKILASFAPAPGGTTVLDDPMRITRSSDDKFYEAARDGLIMRAATACTLARQPFDATHKPAEGAEDFQRVDLLRLAETCLQRAKVRTDRMTRRDIALVAMGHMPTLNRLRIQRDGEAYHTTGTFSSLMLDAQNKTLRMGYQEAEYSSERWLKKGPSVSDLRAIYRIQFSEFPNLEEVPENHDYPEKIMSDARESYKVGKLGAIFTTTWEAVLNDDLDAIGKVPAMQGVAAKRTQNQRAYAVLTANALMSDGVALFGAHASGSNIQTTGGVPTVATLNAGFLAMRLQKGMNGSVSLNITPKYLIVPAALEATAMELLASTTPPAVGGSAVGTSGTSNIYGPGGQRRLELVVDSNLDAANPAGWYLLASSSEIDTIEITFLSGEESPTIETEWDMKKDVWAHKIRQTYGIKAIDWRGSYYNDGA